MPEATPRARLQALIASLETGLLERGAAVRLVLLSALAGEHVLLIGPPGTAKSELARRLHRVFDGARYFERLLTRFSTPEELFGPLSLKALEHDRYERLTDGYLPTASIAFLDEVFKANSAILNALLTLLNEREFDNGSARTRTPLICVVGATNDVPRDESLMAFYDRFLVRVPVAAVSDASFVPLLALPPAAEPPPDEAPRGGLQAITHDEAQQWRAVRAGVALAPEMVVAAQALRAFCASQGVGVSDRRWRQWIGLLRMAALTDGRAEVDAIDLWSAPFIVAAEPAQVATLQDWFARNVVQAAPQEAPWLTRAADAFEVQLEFESRAEAHEGDGSAGKLALARSIGSPRTEANEGRGGPGPAADGNAIGTGTGTGAGEADSGSGSASGRVGEVGMLRAMSAALEAHLRKRYSSVHVASRVAQVGEVLASATERHNEVAAQAAELARVLAGRLWVPPELAAQWLHAKQQTLAVLAALVARLEATRAGFAALPIDAQQPDDVPQPVALAG